jgi:hypothetical protein
LPGALLYSAAIAELFARIEELEIVLREIAETAGTHAPAERERSAMGV